MKTVYVNNSDLPRDKRFTYLTADSVAGGTALTVQSILGFESLTTSSGQIVLIGELGRENTEIRRTDQNNAASGSTVSLRDALQFDHPQDTKVTVIDFNRAEVQWSATATGTKQTITAYPFAIQPDQLETLYNDSTQTTGFYFVRFNETIGNTNSDWSDPIPYAGFDANTVHAIKRRALLNLHEEVDGEVITDEYLDECLWTARREYHKARGKRPFRRRFNVDIGNVSTGMYRTLLPEEVENPTSGENVYGVRIGSHPNMSYYGKKEWDFDYINKPRASLSTAYTVGDTDLYLDTVRDFPDSGTVYVGGTPVTYSARGISGGTLRISSQGSWSSSSGTDVWQNVSFGLPDRFTVWAEIGGSAYIYFNRPLDTAYVDQNVYADYYRTVVAKDSDADVLDEPDFDMYVPYLEAMIKRRKARGAFDLANDSSYQLWVALRDESLRNEYIGADLYIHPGEMADAELP
jgi:hypothetical protein